MDVLDDNHFYMVCRLYRLSIPYTTIILCSAKESTEDKNDILNINATNCIVVEHLTKLAISIFTW